jgi:hypothetical protein
MPVNWTIKGEAGQGWDDSVTTLEARNISSAKLDFKSLEADELTFNIALQDVTNAQYVATPAVSPDSSVQIGSTISVTVTCATAGATIRYTTDGSNPNSSSPVVANGATLTIANPSTLRVFAEKAGLLDSDTKVAEYVMQGVVATGGSVTDTTGFRTHTFLASDSFVVTNPGTIEYLVVAGGGSGGGNSSTRSGGGGGAGGFKTGSIAVTAGTYAITVGAGGMALTPQTSASDGGGSSIGTLVTCAGGGAGASVSGTTAVAGRAGGSGGGGTCAGAAGTGITGQGRNGGGSASTTSGTGGGSGAAGTAVSAATANGGAGTASSITGTAVTYSVGGGVRDPSLTTGNTVDGSVIQNTGRGGAGVFKKATIRIGANGSSGIVVIKYATVQTPNPSNIPSLNAVIPTLRQEVTLYRDGVSFFFGNVTNVRSSIQSGSHDFQITVSGPWWFLEKVPFTSVRQDGSGTSGERITYVFGTASAGQGLKTSIEQAIDRANQLGCPIAPISGGSSVAAMTAFPRITLNQSTCGQVISELVRLVPDAMAYFDYATYPAKLIVTRRPTATAVTFNQSTSPITSIDINPIIELEVQQVTLPSVTRNTVGRTVFQKQESGSAQTGKDITKRQVITISGPELDTFLPNDLFENQTITTSGSITDLAHDSDSSCVSAAKAAGLSRLPVNTYYDRISLVDSRQRAGPSPPVGYVITQTFNVGGYSIKDKSGNSLSGYSIITSGTPSDWTGITTVNVTVSGFMWILRTIDTGDGTPRKPYPKYLDDAGFSYIAGGYTCTQSSCNYVQYYQKAFSFSAIATPGGSSSTTVYKPADYSFINPPAGLADFLRSTQNWIPYEGAITLEEEDVGATRYRGNKINLINSIPAYSAMGALVSGESLEIESGRTTINLGAPARNDYRTLVDKIRKTSQDNIVYV